MQRWIVTFGLVLTIAATAMAQPPAATAENTSSKADTVLVQVYTGATAKDLVLELVLTNADTLAGMVVPLMATAPGVKLAYDSTSFVGGRIDYFQLKSDHQPDSTKPAVLLGLIADMSGSNPPLPPGRGSVAKIYFTGDKAIDPAKVKVEKIRVPPANTLDYTTPPPRMVNITPTFVTRAEKPKPAMEHKEGMGKK